MITKTKRTVTKKTSNLEIRAYFSYNSPPNAKKPLQWKLPHSMSISTNHKVSKLEFQSSFVSICNSIKAVSRQVSLTKPLSLLVPTPRPAYHLTSIELWSAYFYLETYTVLTHQQIPLLLAKSALSCWMYQTVQMLFFNIWSFPRVTIISKLSEDARSLWNTVKQASRPQVILKTQSPICLKQTPATSYVIG